MGKSSSPLRSLSIGGATYDVFLTLEQNFVQEQRICFPIGSKNHIQNVTEACGGGAANTSVGLSRLGLNAHFCGVVGSDQWGEKMRDNLHSEGVDTCSATIVEGETSSFSVILSTKEDRSILTSPGVTEHLHNVTLDSSAIEKADIIYLNHLCETSCVIEDHLVRKMIESSATLTWNPGGCQIDAGMKQPDKAALLRNTHLLLLNVEEAMTFTKTRSKEDAMDKLLEAGATNVCITDGKNGVYAGTGERRYYCPVQETTIVDTTGAGDAFGIGATWALAEGEELKKALIAGTLNASGVVGALGAQTGLLTREEMQNALSSHSLAVQELTSISTP